VPAFPELMQELSGGQLEVRNLARVGLPLDKFMPELPDALAWEPDLVISVFGGRECLYRLKYLKRVRCDPRRPLSGWGWLLPVAWARRLVWGRFVRLMTRRERLGERILEALGARTYQTPADYQVVLQEMVTAINATEAQTWLLEYFDLVLSKYVWSPTVQRENTTVARAVAARSPERVTMVDPKQHLDFSRLILPDGAHFAPEGHRAMAEVLVELIAESKAQAAA
jgi:hypothetical protein